MTKSPNSDIRMSKKSLSSTLKVIQQIWQDFDDIDYFKVSWLRDTNAADHGKILGIEAHWMDGYFKTCGKIQQKPEINIFSVSDP